MQSWVSDKLILKQSRKHGLGLFSRIEIPANELIIIFGGYISQKPDTDGYFLELLPGFYLNNSLSNPRDDLSNFLNHSCDPNAGIRHFITIYTLRNIQAGEEIIIDYFAGKNMADYPDFRCNCQTDKCRFKK